MQRIIFALTFMTSILVSTAYAQATVNSRKDSTPQSLEQPWRDTETRDIERRVLSAISRKRTWTGPIAGPKAQPGKSIVFLASDMRNGGVAGVLKGVEEAANVIGWRIRMIDGQGTVNGRASAFNQALALKPDGIILGGFDAQEQAATITEANKNKLPIVGWHAGADPTGFKGLFYNITTLSQDVAQIAALYAVTESKGKAGVVIFTDSTYSVAIAKSNAMAEIIKACKGCSVLEIVDTPIAETSQRMPGLLASLAQRYGDKWTHSLAINDLYFDFMDAASKKRLVNLSAGDGSESAYSRIRKNQGQSGTVPEPLSLHGWQAVDELNRAFSGQLPSGYSTPVHLVTPLTIVFDGGPKNVFDPENNYRIQYTRIWGK